MKEGLCPSMIGYWKKSGTVVAVSLCTSVVFMEKILGPSLVVGGGWIISGSIVAVSCWFEVGAVVAES